MHVNKAVIVHPSLPIKEVVKDDAFDRCYFLECDSPGVAIPSYFDLFTDAGRSAKEYRRKHRIPETYDPDICITCNDNYLTSCAQINKICSDLYSASRKKPWPILGIAIIEHCTLKQLRIMYEHIPVYLASDPRIADEDKKIILSREASSYENVLNNIEEYY